jgi:hypothetical protein
MDEPNDVQEQLPGSTDAGHKKAAIRVRLMHLSQL